MDTSEVWTDLPPTKHGRQRWHSVWETVPIASISDIPKCVYVFGAEGGPYKIGVSFQPEVRVSQVKGERIWGTLSVEEPYRVERAAHGILASHAIGGEWFDCTLAEAVAAVEQAAERGS